MTVDLIVSKKTMKKTKNEHQKAGKIIQIQKYLNKKNPSQRIIRQETGPHQLANARPYEKVRRIFLARY